MARENPAYARIREEYATKYLIAREEADLRRAEIHLAIPEVAEIDRALGRTGLSLMEASMQGEDVQARIAAVRRTNEDLRHVRADLLTAHGYPADYTEVRYECPLCNDSGFVDAKMCICMKKKLVEAGFEASGMGNLLREQSFENFDLTYYQSDPTALRRMEQILAWYEGGQPLERIAVEVGLPEEVVASMIRVQQNEKNGAAESEAADETEPDAE